MEKTREHQQKEKGVEEMEKKVHKQQEPCQQPDEDEKPPFENNGDEIPVELGNAYEKIVNGKKELENGDYKSYNDVKVEVREEKSEMNVYYDKQEGKWKCRSCSWTYQSGSPWTEHIEHPKWHLHMQINPKTVNRQEPCFYCEIEEHNGVWSSAYVKNPGEPLKANAQMNGESLKANTRKKYNTEITEARDDEEPTEESDEKSTEFDVEKVLEEQDTHDLFCPNCNSCITKRVILRKRKRKTDISSEDSKRNKLEAVDNSLDGRLPCFFDDNARESEAEVFRCLSCFSFFTPSGSGFRLFKVLGDKSDEQIHRPVAPTKKSWFSSILASRREGRGRNKDVRDNIVTESKEEVAPKPQVFVAQASVNGDDTSSFLAKDQKLVPKPKAGVRGESKDGKSEGAGMGSTLNDLMLDTYYQIDSSTFSNEMQPDNEKGYSVTQLSGRTLSHTEEDAILETRENEPNIQVHSSNLENSHLDAKLSETADMKAYFEEPDKAVRDNLSIFIKDPAMFPRKEVAVTVESKQTTAEAGAGTDTIIVVEESVEPKATQEPQGLTSDETRPSPHTERVDYERFRGIEIVKSIVYGGLPELIASLGLVSSAVGADTPTLKILALGLANIIGGLFIIGKNLWDLKGDQHSNPTDQITENDSVQLTTQDRYQELLGRRENFWAHVTVALLSFLIFGMLPPVICAFSFRESENKDYKLIAVAAASLVCIIILSTGKAYIQRPPKAYLKTISLYVLMVFMTSGVSYALGDLFKKLLENLGWFSAGSDLSLNVLEMRKPVLPIWALF